MRLAVLFAASIGLLGCTVQVPAEPVAAETAPETPPDRARAPKPEPQPQPSVEPTPPAPLPDRFAGLGQPCADLGDGHAEVYCGADGKAAGLAAPVDAVHGIAWDRIEPIYDRPSDERDRGASLKIGVEGERLWIAYVSCGICRRIMGVSIVADLPRLDEAHLLDIQKRIGLESAKPMRTAAEWRAFAAQWGREPDASDP